uniref:Uncharacterized protein n=1 Tax=Arundo donax TaxID=35708 RepID=A0A0A9AEU7_ARUDO
MIQTTFLEINHQLDVDESL